MKNLTIQALAQPFPPLQSPPWLSQFASGALSGSIIQRACLCLPTPSTSLCRAPIPFLTLCVPGPPQSQLWPPSLSLFFFCLFVVVAAVLFVLSLSIMGSVFSPTQEPHECRNEGCLVTTVSPIVAQACGEPPRKYASLITVLLCFVPQLFKSTIYS
jgi:hypothetical protein